MKALLSLILVTLSVPVFAGVAAYSGTSGQKLFIEDGGKDAYFIKFTGLKSPWENKVIKTTRTGRQDSYRYGFEYREELSSGVKVKSYNIVVDGRATLVAGTVVPQIILYTQETGNDGVTLSWDKALTESSQALNLADEHKKKTILTGSRVVEWKKAIQTGSISALIEGLMSVSNDSELRVVLHTGHQLVGVPLKCDTENGMFLFEVRTTPPVEMAWIPFSSVTYLHLVNPAASLKCVTGGKVFRDPSVAGVSSLELRRKADKTFSGMNPPIEINWPSEMTGPESLGISDFIDALSAVVTTLQQDVAGKDALAGLQKISVSTTGDLSASASSGRLTLTFPAANTDISIKEKLLTIIEKAL